MPGAKSLHFNRSHLLLLIILSMVGIFLRLQPVFLDSVHFSFDQGDDLTEVRRLIVDHQLSLIGRASGLQGVFMGPLWTFILAIPYWLGGGNPAAATVFFSIWGVAAIWWTYFIVRKISTAEAAILAGLYTAVSPVFINASQVALSPNPLTYLMIIYLWLLWEITYDRKQQKLVFLGLITGIFFQFEIAFALFLVPSTLLVLTFLGSRVSFKKREILNSLLVFCFTFLPQILFDLRHDFLISKAILGVFQGTNQGLGREQAGLFQRFFLRFGSLVEDFAGATALVKERSSAFIVLALFAVAGWYLLIKSKKRKTLKLGAALLLLTASMYSLFTLYPGPLWTWYRAGMPIVFILFLSLGWTEIMKKYKFGKNTAIIIFTVFTLAGIRSAFFSNLEYQNNPAALANQKQALDKIYQEAGSQQFSLYVYTPPVYTYVWDHLLFWYAQPKYNYLPQDYGYQYHARPDSIFFLIIEPDDMQYRIDGFRGEFTGFAKPLSIWKMPGNIGVEKWQVK